MSCLPDVLVYFQKRHLCYGVYQRFMDDSSDSIYETDTMQLMLLRKFRSKFINIRMYFQSTSKEMMNRQLKNVNDVQRLLFLVLA